MNNSAFDLLRDPASVPDHELLRRIGSGAYGEVWIARNIFGEFRAVKIVWRNRFAEERPFRREFEGIKRFEPISRSHPSQLSILHVGQNQDAGYFYYVMELADSFPLLQNGDAAQRIADPDRYVPHTLRQSLERNGCLPIEECLKIGLSLTTSLTHLHERGLVHRDIKPSNIIFVNGMPKLSDTGLVSEVGDAQSIVGTEGYIPPEGVGTVQADIFSLGKVLYETSTGLDRRSFPKLPEDLANRKDAKRLVEFNEVLLRACARDLPRRYSRADQLRGDLAFLQSGHSLKRRNRWQAAARGSARAFAALGAVAFIGGVFIFAERSFGPVQSGTPGTPNHAAWEALQRANHMGGTLTREGLSNAIVECQLAKALDPNFARAWCDLARFRLNLVTIGSAPGSIMIPQAQQEVRKALQLDRGMSAAYAVLARCNLSLDYDFVSAEPLFRKAIRLDPNEPGPKCQYAVALTYYGRFEEAETLFKELIRDYPTQPNYRELLGETYGFARRYSEAVDQHEAVLRLDPNRSITLSSFVELLWAMGQRDRAAQLWLRRNQLDGFSEDYLARGEKALKRDGPEGFLQFVITEFEQKQAHGEFVSPYGLARLYGLAGQKSRALDYLELAVVEHREFVLTAKVHLAFKDFQDEPRYHAVLKRLRLE